MKNSIFTKDEWTQEEFLRYQKLLKKDGIEIILVDTILKPIDGIKSVTYNPYELLNYPKDSTVFLFYCDTGKSTKERLEFYRAKLPGYKCVSLRGGRGYWRPNFRLLDKSDD